MFCIKCDVEIQDNYIYCPWCGKKQVVSQTATKRHRRSNGEGSVYKRGDTWQAEVVIGTTSDGKPLRRYKGGFKTKREAIEYIPTLRESQPQRDSRTRTLAYYYESIYKTDLSKLSKSKQKAYHAAWSKMESMKNRPIKTFTVVQLRDLVSDEAPTFYPARDMKTLLSKIFALAIADQQITVNPADYITLPTLNESERQAWNNDELQTIWSAYEAEDCIAAYLLLMIYTGMMPGELNNCTRGMININERRIIGAGLKTDIRKETPIVIAEFLVPVIERILTFTPNEPTHRILYTDRWSFYDEYHSFTAKYGIRDLPMYSCRHTTATALALGTNVAPSIIQKIMRHARFTTTQRYIHPDTSDALAGINQLTV